MSDSSKWKNSNGCYKGVYWSFSLWWGEKNTENALAMGMPKEYAEIYGDFQSMLLLQGFTQVSVNGVRAYKNIRTGEILYDNEVGSANNISNIWKQKELMDELSESGNKCDLNDVVAVTKMQDGELIWLENDNEKSGLEHIMNHASEFADKGITQNEIVDFIMTALKEGEIVGYQGKGTGRPIYKLIYKGYYQAVAITVGSNGYIVGANPKSVLSYMEY